MAKIAKKRSSVRKIQKPREKIAKKVKSNLRPKPLDQSLFGAYPGLSDWAIPLLEELRNE